MYTRQGADRYRHLVPRPQKGVDGDPTFFLSVMLLKLSSRRDRWKMEATCSARVASVACSRTRRLWLMAAARLAVTETGAELKVREAGRKAIAETRRYVSWGEGGGGRQRVVGPQDVSRCAVKSAAQTEAPFCPTWLSEAGRSSFSNQHPVGQSTRYIIDQAYSGL